MAFFNINIPELSGSDTAICLDNLDLLGIRQSRITESMLAMLSELADAVIRDAGGDPDTANSILLSLQRDPEEGADDDRATANAVFAMTTPANREAVLSLSLHTEMHLRLILYRFIAERMPDPPAKSTPHPVPEAARGRIAYMAGAFADKAYARLSNGLPAPRAATFHSFVDACEEVRGGLCEYCILPVENSQSGKLTAFSRLILRYGLHIVAVCDLENGTSPGQFTRFALLRKAPDDAPLQALCAPAGCVPDNAPRFWELLHTPASPATCDLLTAAHLCGLSTLRVDTLPRFEELDFLWESTPDGPVLPTCCVFTQGKSGRPTPLDLATFTRFLSLEAGEDTLMGVYHLV